MVIFVMVGEIMGGELNFEEFGGTGSLFAGFPILGGGVKNVRPFRKHRFDDGEK